MKSVSISLALSLGTLVIAADASAQTQRIYVAPDDHTDYMWSATDTAYAAYFPQSLDFYLDQINATSTRPSDLQMRWNTDGSLWMWEYERARTSTQFASLMDRVRDGHISMPLNTLVLVQGTSPLEAVIRDMYYAGRLERRFNLRFPVAIAMENQTAAYGLASIWAGAGARYTWKGVCGRFAANGYCTRVPAAGDRQYDAYWWTGPDGSRILTKWNSEQDRLPSASDSNQGPGGYAETRYPREAVPFVSTSSAFKTRWPYSTIGLFGAGWDDATSYFIALNDSVSSQTGAATDLSTPDRRVIVSNQLDFFRDFETNYGASLPSQGVSFGNEWDVNVTAFAEKSARVRRAVEKLRAAEAMATVVEMEKPGTLAGRESARDTAFRNMGLFFEHNVGGGGNITNAQRLDFQERMALGIETYVNDLHDAATRELGNLIDGSAGGEVFAYNPLGFARSEIAKFSYTGSGQIHVVDERTNAEVPSQIIGTGTDRYLQFLATNVPAFGYVKYRVVEGAGKIYPDVATFDGTTLTSSTYQLAVNERGAITSLIGRTAGNRQWVKETDGRLVNDFGSGTGRWVLESSGPVSATIRADISGTLNRTVRITLYAALPRIDIANVVNGSFDSIQTHSFSFNIDRPLVRHEELGVIMKARLAPEGNYSPRATNSLYDWLTINHFADMTSGNGRYGMTLVNHDAYVMRLGNSTTGTLDTTTPRIDVMLGGRIPEISVIDNQGTDTQITHRFSLVPHAGFGNAIVTRSALSATNPLVTATATGLKTAPLRSSAFSSFVVRGSNVLSWALKPAEEGIGSGVVFHLWNQGSAAAPISISANQRYRVTSTQRTSLIETNVADDDPIALPNAKALRAGQFGAVRLLMTKK